MALAAAVLVCGCKKQSQREPILPAQSADLTMDDSAARKPAVVEETPAASGRAYAPPKAQPDSGPLPTPVFMTREPGQAPGPSAGPELAAQTYVVQKGDTLYSISKRFYGSGRYWAKIDEANRGKYKNASAISVGTVLVIPPK
jgi:nucleoid-associated protein YgaU